MVSDRLNRLVGGGLGLVSLAVACAAPAPSQARTDAVGPPRVLQDWVAGELNAAHALQSRRTPGGLVDPTAVIQVRRDYLSPGVEILWVQVLGSGHGDFFSVLQVGGELFRLSGFVDPQVRGAWSVLSRSGGMSCDQVQSGILAALSPEGGIHTLTPDSVGAAMWQHVQDRFMEVAPATWPRDTTVTTAPDNVLRVATVFSLSAVEYPAQTWTATAYSLVIRDDCSLLGWASRSGPVFQVDREPPR